MRAHICCFLTTHHKLTQKIKFFYIHGSPISDRALLFETVLRRWLILPVRVTYRWRCLWSIGGMVLITDNVDTEMKLSSQFLISWHGPNRTQLGKTIRHLPDDNWSGKLKHIVMNSKRLIYYICRVYLSTSSLNSWYIILQQNENLLTININR